ncbi:MAG: DNA topology modulation protein [Pyrinomonadaceae bacterium]
MKKVLVIGSPGAGKSVFSRQLGEITRLPVIHLDRHYWRTGWIEPSRDVWSRQLEEMLKGDEWIMDGNYGGTMELRLEYCDTVIFLDFPRHICTWRIAKRTFQYRGRNRPDLAAGCPEKLDLEFIRLTWTYPSRSRPRVMERLTRVAERVSIVKLKTGREADRFLRSLETERNRSYGN